MCLRSLGSKKGNHAEKNITAPIRVAAPNGLLVMTRSGMTGKGIFASPVRGSSVPGPLVPMFAGYCSRRCAVEPQAPTSYHFCIREVWLLKAYAPR